MTTQDIAAIVRRSRLRYANEDELQEGLAAALTAAGARVEREVRLTSRDRIDLLVGTIGIEVKIAGDARRVERQLERYAASDRVTDLILVTNRARHTPPGMIDGKPVTRILLLGAGL